MSRVAADSLQRPHCSKGCINVYFSRQSTSCGSVAVQFKLPLARRLLCWYIYLKKKERFQFGKRPICCSYRHIYSPMSHSHVLHSVSYCSFHLSTFRKHILPTGNWYIDDSGWFFLPKWSVYPSYGWYFGCWFHCCARVTITWKCRLLSARDIQVFILQRLKIKRYNQHCYVSSGRHWKQRCCDWESQDTSSLNVTSRAANSEAWPFDYTRAGDKGNPKRRPTSPLWLILQEPRLPRAFFDPIRSFLSE